MHIDPMLVLWSFLGVGGVFSAYCGFLMRMGTGWLCRLGAPSVVAATTLGVMLGAGYSVEYYDKKLGWCCGTSDTNIWFFVLLPLFAIPIYAVLLFAFRRAGKPS